MDKNLSVAQPVLTAQNLSVERGGLLLLKDINLQIARGMITMVLGHNGAGKTLLMQALHGILPPTSGNIKGIERHLQKMVFQKPVMLRRSAEAYFDFVCPDVSISQKQHWFHRAGLTGRMNSPARALSGGEKQKLSLITALASQPELLFLDEPCANLDFEATAFVETELLAAREKGVTILMSCHHKAQAERLADYILLLKRGRIAEYSEKDRFFSDAQSEAAREYLAFS